MTGDRTAGVERTQRRAPGRARLCVLCAILAAAALGVQAVGARGRTSTSPRPSAVTVGHSQLDVPCGPTGTPTPADWYFPTSRQGPRGVVWLQHGFFRSNVNIVSLASYIAAHTNAIVVAPAFSSNPFAAGGCWINGTPMHRAVAGLFATRAALQRSADAARGRHVPLPRAFVLTGHSAGGNLATAAAGFTTLPGGAIGELRGVVLYDAVDYQGDMSAALARLSGRYDRPVLQIASPPSLCNAGAAGTRALVAARPGRFVGVELLGGTHVDAEGPNSDPFAEWLCGHPLTANVEAVRTIAADWITSLFTGSSPGILGGAPGQRIAVGGATAVVLPAP